MKAGQHPFKLNPCNWCGYQLYKEKRYHAHCLKLKREIIEAKRKHGIVDNLY